MQHAYVAIAIKYTEYKHLAMPNKITLQTVCTIIS